MISPTKEMLEIQLGLWNVSRYLDVPTRELSDGTFEKAIVTLRELWERFRAEMKRQAEVPEHE